MTPIETSGAYIERLRRQEQRRVRTLAIGSLAVTALLAIVVACALDLI